MANGEKRESEERKKTRNGEREMANIEGGGKENCRATAPVAGLFDKIDKTGCTGALLISL